MNKLTTLLPLLALATFANADTISIPPDHHCLPGSLASVESYITDYAHYAQSSGAKWSLLGQGAVTMIESTETPKPSSQNHEDSLVHIRLQPGTIEDTKLFPRFYLRCQLTPKSAAAAHYECHVATDQDMADYGREPQAPKPYGLSSFHSVLELALGGGGCAANEVSLDYTIDMESNPDEVAALHDAYPLSRAIPATYFFQKYYEQFLAGWLADYHP